MSEVIRLLSNLNRLKDIKKGKGLFKKNKTELTEIQKWKVTKKKKLEFKVERNKEVIKDLQKSNIDFNKKIKAKETDMIVESFEHNK